MSYKFGVQNVRVLVVIRLECYREGGRGRGGGGGRDTMKLLNAKKTRELSSTLLNRL